MSGSTLITIAALGTETLTSSGTYAIDVGLGSTLDIQGSPGNQATVTVGESGSGLLSLGLLDTTNISYADEVVSSLAGISSLSEFNIGLDGASSATGHGTLEIGSGASISAVDGINFYGTNNDLILDTGVSVGLLDSMNNFGAGDTIDLHGVTATSATFTQNSGLLGGTAPGGTVTLYNNGSVVETIGLANGTYSSNAFQVTSDQQGGTDLTVCFLEGTNILGLHCDIAVEDMEKGDRLITKTGAMRPVRWVGRRTIDAERHPRPETIWPIRIERGAIDDGLPERTLYLSPDHAIYIDGYLIPAKALVNGRSITQERRRHITYYHVELDAHDVLLAESLPVESYLETGNRHFFDNGKSTIALHPDFAQTLREKTGCAPFAETGPVVAAVRARINQRLPAPERTSDPMLRALAGGRMLPITQIDPLTFAIRLPVTATDVRLLSNVMVPAETDAWSDDRRRLGLDVGALVAVAEGRQAAIPLDSSALTTGWYDCEEGHRWSNGAALVPASLLEGVATLVIRLSAATSYPMMPGQAAPGWAAVAGA